MSLEHLVLVVDDQSPPFPRGLFTSPPTYHYNPQRSTSYPVDAIDRLVSACAYLIALKLKGADTKHVIDDFGLSSKEVLGGMVVLERAGKLEKVLSKFCAWGEARLLGNPLPAQIEGTDYSYLFGRKVRSFLIARIPNGRMDKRPAASSQKFASSLLMLKKATVSVSKEYIDSSFSDYQITLGTSPPTEEQQLCSWLSGWEEVERSGSGGGVGGDGGQVSFVDTELGQGLRDSILVRLRSEGLDRVEARMRLAICKTIREVFRPVPPSEYKDDEIVPSMSSSFSTPRKRGGAAQELINESLGPSIGPRATQLLSMHYHPTFGIHTVRGCPVWLKGSFVYFNEENQGRAPARISEVLEPCKVRWISIGQADQYYRAKAWNRLIYTQMPKHPTFELATRPLSVEDVNNMRGKFLLSGDYKGATDTLDPYWSQFVFEQITRLVYKHATAENSVGDWVTRTIGLAPMLTRHAMVRKQMGKPDIEFNQQTGQLMGSYLSFPILCVLNAAVNRLYLDPSLETPLSELPLLVNGDDVMMSSDDDFSDWAAHISLVGLKPSLGKNYVHQYVCCMNSEFYCRETIGGEFERNYPWQLNLLYGKDSDADGGLFGNHVNRPDFLSLSTIGAMARQLVHHQSESDTQFLLTAFIKENLKTLKSTNRSWWTPEQLGGLGLPCTQDTVKRITETGRLVATYLLTRPSPDDVLMYTARGAPESTNACQAWMRENNLSRKRAGYIYQWLAIGEEDTSPVSHRMVDFLGLGTVPVASAARDRYDTVLKKALNAKHALKPCSDETLIEFSRNPRRCGWVHPNDNWDDPAAEDDDLCW